MNKKVKKKPVDVLLEEALVPFEEHPYKVPKNWVWLRLGSIVRFIGGGTPSKSKPEYWNGDIPWVSVKDVKDIYLTRTVDSITSLGVKNSSTSIANPNEVLLITRMSPGKSTITKIQTSINQDLKIVRPLIEIPPYFLWAYFNRYMNEIESISTGSTVKGIRIDRLNKLPIPFPPISEQKRIADKVERL